MVSHTRLGLLLMPLSDIVEHSKNQSVWGTMRIPDSAAVHVTRAPQEQGALCCDRGWKDGIQSLQCSGCSERPGCACTVPKHCASSGADRL